MRRRVALIASLALAGDARADEDLFGLPARPAAPPPRCDDARTFGCAGATDPLDDVSPYALRSWLPASYLLRLPIGDARHDQVAHHALGVARDDAGVAIGGATGLENRWTIDGAPADSPRTGNVDTRVPVVFLAGLLVSAGGFAARDRASTGGTIDVELRRGGDRHELDAYAWAGLTAPARERPIADASFQLRRLSVATGPEASASVVATGPLGRLRGGRAWYAAGVAPSLGRSELAWRAARLTDADGDGVADGFPGQVALEPIADTSAATVDYLIPAMARAGWDRGPHRLALTLIGHAARDSAFFANATLPAAGIDRTSWTGDAIATWRGSWRSTRARAQLAWHRSTRTESGRDPAARGLAQLGTAFVPDPLAQDPAVAAACSDGDGDPYPQIANCPVPAGFFLSGGAGNLTDAVADRPSASFDLAHRRGDHVVRAGATLEDTRLIVTSAFSGDEQLRSLFPGHAEHRRYFLDSCEPDAAAPCSYASGSRLSYRARYTAAYLEDTFSPAPGIQVNGGLRWELMWVGTELHLSNQLAPRLGVAWDPIGGGRSRLWASLGRSFIMLPAGIGPTVIARDRTVRDIELAGTFARAVDFGNPFAVAPDIAPAAQDEATLGVELGLPATARVAAWLQGRWLRRGYETVLANELTGEVQFDNPGRAGGEPATRASAVLAIEAAIAPGPRTWLRASVLHGRTTGSWAGPFDPRQGAMLYDGSEYDTDDTNLVGPLPTDAGTRAFVELERRGTLAGVAVAAATRLTVQSGRPRDVLASTDLGVIYLLPRGAGGRNPMVTQANLRLSARWRETDFTLDVLDAFSRRQVTSTAQTYTSGAVRPIRGGTLEDLVFARTETGAPVQREPGYGLPIAFQPPLTALLGVRRSF